MPKFLWAAGLTAAIIAAVGVLLMNSGQTTARGVGDLVLLVLTVAALVYTVAAARTAHARQRQAWIWQALGVAACLVAAVLWCYYTVARGMEAAPFPSIADGFDLLYPIGACLALVHFPAGNLSFRARVLFDGVIVSVALFEVIWQLGLKDTYQTGADGSLRFAVMVAYPMTNVLIVAVAVMVLPRVRGTGRTVVALLTAGAVLNTLSDGANVYIYVRGAQPAVTAFVYTAAVGATVLMILAPLIARRIPDVDHPDQVAASAQLGHWLPYVALALAVAASVPVVLLPLSHGPLLATSTVLLLALAVRHLIVVLDNRRLHGVVTDQALRDPLTGLANRALFRDRAAHAIHLRQRDNRAVAMILLDLNDFRQVNSEFGQALGDELLILVASRLMNAVRAGDTVARIGADEFAILMEGAADQARIIAHRVVRAFDDPFVLAGRAIVVRPSIGFAMAASDTDDISATELLEQVDLAMQDAKASGDRGLHAFTEDMRSTGRIAVDRGDRDVELLRDLRQAIDQDALSVVYQPKIDLRTGKPVSVEALVRWPHHERGLLAPDSFLPLVRQHGLMRGVTELVLSRALDDVVTWKAKGVRVPVSVNLTAPSVADTNLPVYIAGELATRGLEPTMLTVEITEDLLLENTARARNVLDRLRASGTRIALDDFGSGYSALWYLRDLSFDEVKLDRQFIVPLLTDPRAAMIVRAVVDLAHDLGGTVVAEGVENGATAHKLRDYGCEIAQGFYYSPPLPAQETLAFFKESGLTAPVAATPN